MARTKRKAARHEANDMVAEYRGKLPLYHDFANRCKELLEQLLQAEGIRVHSVTCRAKSWESLEGKLSRGEKKHQVLGDVTDLAGIRIITYLADEVEAVGTMVEREFAVIPEHSIDKGQLLDPDRFGYLSLHYVCTLSHKRSGLAEYGAYKECVCEIQVRSILQHAWAEIEHDLGYKAVQGIPRPMQRRFSRLAGLLEVADDEFMRLRDELAVYAEEVKRDIAEKPGQVLLDNVSLMAFIQQDDTVRRVDEELAEWVGAELREPSDEWVEHDVAYLRDVGLDTIEDVRAALSEREGVIVRQWQYRIEKGKHKTLRKGICLFHLWQVLLAEEGPAKLEAAFSRFHIVSRPGDPEGVTDIVEAVERASTGTSPSRTRRGEQP